MTFIYSKQEVTYFEDDLHLAVEANTSLASVHGDIATDLLADVVEGGNEAVMDAGAVDVEDAVLSGVGAVELTHSFRPLTQLIQLLLQTQTVVGAGQVC